MIVLIICGSNFVLVLESLHSSNSCRFEFLVFGVIAGFKPTTSGLTVTRSGQVI